MRAGPAGWWAWGAGKEAVMEFLKAILAPAAIILGCEFVGAGLLISRAAFSQTTNAEEVYKFGRPIWGLTVYRAGPDGYRATGPMRFHRDPLACESNGQAVETRIVFADLSCTAMYCRPYALWICTKLGMGASGRLAQCADPGELTPCDR